VTLLILIYAQGINRWHNKPKPSSRRSVCKVYVYNLGGVYKYFSGFSGAGEVYKYFSGGAYKYFSGVYKYFSGTEEMYKYFSGMVYINTSLALEKFI